MNINTIGLPDLNGQILDAIFDNVYDKIPGIHNQSDETKKLLQEPIFIDLIDLLLRMQKFNYIYRKDQLIDTYDIAHQVMEFEINSEGTSLWLALILAIKELYGLKDNEMKKILKKIHIDK